MMTLLLAPAVQRTLSAQGTFCSFAIDVTVATQSASALFPTGGTWTPGTTINVTGTFTIDQSITFDNLDFIMSPGAKIVVEGNGVVAKAQNNTHFFGCETLQMWRGITVKSGASIEFTTNTLIDDAWIALEFIKTANISACKIENCTLSDNNTGIYYIGPGKFNLGSFSGNTIRRSPTGTLQAPPSGLTYTGSKLFRGITLLHAEADFAANAAQRNTIRDCRFGIHAMFSSVTVANCTFRSNSNDPSVAQDTIDGTGIFAYSSTLTVGGSGTQNCIFSLCQNSGIISRNTRGLTVSAATFTSPERYAIRCAQSIKLSSPISITGNDITMNGAYAVAGIYVERPPSGSVALGTVIKNNTLRVNGGHQKAPIIMIDVQGKTSATDFVEIDNNTIDIDVAYTRLNGIRITGKGDNYQIINDNDLSWELTSNPPYIPLSRGIIAADLLGHNNSVIGNDITSKLDGEKSFLKAGIYVENNPFTLFVCENDPIKNHQNIYCAGNLGNTLLIKNLIGDAAYGLYCKIGTSMPPQDRFENRWTGTTYVNRGAEYQGGTPTFKIFYDPSSTISDDKPSIVFPTTGWFEPVSGSNSVCGGAGFVTEKERDFIDGTTSPDATAANWDTRQGLLYKLMRFPELTTNDIDAANYLSANATANSSPWRFARAEWLFDQAYALSNAQQTAFANMVAEYHDLSEDLADLDVQQAQDTTTIDATIAQQRVAAFGQLVVVADSLEQLRTQADLGVQQSLTTASSYVQNLPTAEGYEANLKDILGIAIRYAQGDSLVESDFAVLRAIAAQCPGVGGVSVRRAPQWLLHEEGVTYIDKDWDGNCATPLVLGASVPALETIRIVPNPANDEARVLFPNNSTGRWFLTDMAGRTTLDGNIESAVLDIPTTNTKNGMYLLTCRFSNGEVSTVKFSICH